jgi:putative transposase
MTAAMQAGVFRLYPNREQAAALARWCGAARWLWNELLRHNQERYDAEGKFLFAGELSAMLPAMKREHTWLADPPAISLVDVTRSLDLALRDFLRRKTPDQGFPRFKRKRWGEGSVYLTGQGLRIEAASTEPSKARGRIKLPKIGWCRIRGGRWPNGRVISGTIRRDGDRWHVSLRWGGEVPDPLPAPTRASIGVDVGLKNLAAASDGKKDEALKHMRRVERRLKRAQRRLSRREKEKQNRRRQATKVRRLHRIVRNRRRDHLHKISRTLTAKAALICVEGHRTAALSDREGDGEGHPCQERRRHGPGRAAPAARIQSGMARPAGRAHRPVRPLHGRLPGLRRGRAEAAAPDEGVDLRRMRPGP